MFVGIEDVLLAAREICVYLPREQRILGDVGSSRVFFQWKQEEPGDPDQDTENGEVGRKIQQAPITTNGKYRWSY